MTGRLAVVTGASSGIGRDTARRLGAAGWTVVLIARRREPLEALAAELDAAGGHGVPCPLDAGDGDAVVEAAARVERELGAPDVLVHCAGAGRWRYVEDTSPAEAAGMIAAPYLAAFHVTHAFMRGMLARRRGTIVHVNSPAAILPWAGATGYAATRFALRGLHEALCQDLVGTGVRSCHVVFGEVSSAYFDANPGSHERLPAIARLIPVSTPDDCARVLMQVIARPRRQLVHPFVLRLFMWTHQIAPWLVRALVTATQARRA